VSGATAPPVSGTRNQAAAGSAENHHAVRLHAPPWNTYLPSFLSLAMSGVHQLASGALV
jgi:hypothetical protein